MASPTPTPDTVGRLSDAIPDDESCQLLGPTALVVQGVLGVLVILSLVYKRHREPHKRPWKIWLFDVSKQVVGQMFVHGANVLVSGLISQYTSANACVFYFLHILLDTTLGVAFLYVILHFLTYVFVEKLELKGFESGVYGTPPSIKFWARQAALYVLSLTTMKLLVILILILIPGIFSAGEWLLSWTRIGTGDYVQVIFTMGVFPIIMNVAQFWLIDSIVKASAGLSLDEDPAGGDAVHDREPLFRASSDDEDNNPYRPNDIENSRPHRRSVSPPPFGQDRAETGASTPVELKQSETSSYDEAVDHAYPPPVRQGTSTGNVPLKPARNLLKKAKRRQAPAPLSLRTNHQPAINSPGLPPAAVPQVPFIPSTQKVEAVHQSNNSWTENWDGPDDWANQVGEEEWKGRGLERKDLLRSVWDGSSTIQVGS